MTDQDPNNSRRGFLAKAGIGAAVAWVAPTVVSAPAQALGSVPPPPVPLRPFFVCASGIEVSPGANTGTVDVTACNFQAGDVLFASTAIHTDSSHPWDLSAPAGWTTVGNPQSASTGSPNSGIHGHLFQHTFVAGETSYTFTRSVVPPDGGASAHWTLLIVGYRSSTSLPLTVSVVNAGVAVNFGPDLSFPGAFVADPDRSTVFAALNVDTSPDVTYLPLPLGWSTRSEIGTGPHPEAYFADTSLPAAPNPGTLNATTWALSPAGSGHIVGWQVQVTNP